MDKSAENLAWCQTNFPPKFLSAENFVRRNILSAEILSKSFYITTFDFMMLSKMYISDEGFKGRLSRTSFNESPVSLTFLNRKIQFHYRKQYSNDHLYRIEWKKAKETFTAHIAIF